MRFPQASLLLTASMALVAECINVVELDLVFPRNETYAPTEDFPIVFASSTGRQNHPRFLAQHHIPGRVVPLELTNLTDPYLVYRYYNGTEPGHWWLTWHLSWQSSDVDAVNHDDSDGGLFNNTYSSSRMFTIQNSTSAPQKEVDLAAATADGKCGDHGGSNAVGKNVTDTTMNAPSNLHWAGRDTCELTTNTTSAPPASSPDPFSISISSEAAASMSAHLLDLRYNWIDPPDNCPRDDESSAQPLVFVGVTGLLAV